MRIKCECSLRQRAGDGCSICNTEYFISTLPTPTELSNELSSEGFSEDQAAALASEIYQPLLGLIETLNDKIQQIERALL